MKKLLLFLVFAGFLACENEIIAPEIEADQEISISTRTGGVSICHKNAGEIVIGDAALETHIEHGDAVDMDGDGFYNAENPCSEIDCDDTNADVNPSAEEICGDEIDNNCNGEIDEGCLAIGDLHEGGIIFFLDDTGQHGLVAALADHQVGRTQQYNAVNLCADLELEGYDDWFLPSKDELNLMYMNLHLNGLGGFIDQYYWSSTKVRDNTGNYFTAWLQSFYNGDQFVAHLGYTWYVRAVRAF